MKQPNKPQSTTASASNRPTTATAGKPKPNAQRQIQDTPPVFERINYIIMAVGILVMALGYFLMVGGGTDPNNPNVFNAAEKYSAVRITFSPIIIIIGILIEIVAIMYKPKANPQAA
ncbi:MAG: DUF3098 domain-containing protein [Chitinophagales bacterium]|nr:DUF3098 domain-containing protein [Chitinophagales bacterium]